MPSLFRPTYTRTDPETGAKTVHRLRKWYGRYRDGDGAVQRVPLCTDKTAAQAMLANLIRKVERGQAGLVDPAAEQLARTIEAHIEEFRNHLLAKARSAKHIAETIRIISTVASACRCRILSDLQGAAGGLEEYRVERLESGSSYRTINADLTAIRSFCRWLLSTKRMHDDPTAGLCKLNEDEDPRRERRALTDAEAHKLIAGTHASTRIYRGLTGTARAALYLLAQRTGLRRNELRSLTPRSFDLAGTPPTVSVQARSSKRRRKEVLPLSDDTTQCIAALIANRPPSELIWPGSWWRRSAEMLREDLLDAGIEPQDEEGRVVDFHGQRTTFITGLARAGVAPATAQRLARHSDINLTMGVYTRLEMDELADAVNTLPELRLAAPLSVAGPSAPSERPGDEPQDADLTRVVDAWPSLSDRVRSAILAVLATSELGTQR